MKYLLNGQAVEVVEITKSGFLVQYFYENESDKYIDDEIHFVDRVFDNAPTEKFDKSLTVINEKIKQRQAELRNLEKTIADINTKNKSVFEKFGRCKQLKRLEDYIDGKITHCVSLGWSLDIVDIKNIDADHDGIKLLSLFGRSNGDLTYKLNQYQDGSGYWNKIVPCLSYEEAVNELKEYVHAEINKGESCGIFIEVAKKYGFDLPAECLQKYRAEKIKNLNRKISEYLENIAICEKEIADFPALAS